MVEMTKPTRPICRYHGGKWLLADWIISHFPEHRVYTESFGGGGSVLLQKKPCYAEIYNDLDSELVNLFRVVREQGEQLARKLEVTPFARDEYNAAFEATDDPVEQARRTVIRSYMGFGSNSLNRKIKSGFRSNSNRSGTTPAQDWRNFPDCLAQIVDRLRGVVIENRDACEVMKTHDSVKTLHYVDPPYVHSTRSKHLKNHGYNHELTDEQHVELARFLTTLQGMVIVSGYWSDLYREIFKGWRYIEKAAHADGARPRVEVLWFRNVPENCLWGGGHDLVPARVV